MQADHKMLSEGRSKAFDQCPNAAYQAARDERMAAEAARVEAVRGRGMVPEACGPDIPAAPARGTVRLFRPIEVVPGSAGTARPAGYRGPGEDRPRAGLRRADVFDVIEEHARRAHGAKGEDARPFLPPFTPGQVAIARIYRDLVERHAAGGVKCSSLEGRAADGGGGGFMDAFLAEGIAIGRLRSRIGGGVAMAVRRVRPSRRGPGAKVITDRALVDDVCLGGLQLGEVLERFGWSKFGANREALRRALAAALDRMQGYDLARPKNGT